VLAPERIRGVETGACPHTAIRDDITANLLAVEDLEVDFDPVDLVLVESGGDNLTATFSPALVDAQIFVLDVAGGGDVVRKGGPGISRADLLVVNKTDLAPYVSVDADLMVRQGREARGGRPVLGLTRTAPEAVEHLVAWVEDRLAAFRAGTLVPEDPGPMAAHHHAHHHAHDHDHEPARRP
jgi:urease accessory protein